MEKNVETNKPAPPAAKHDLTAEEYHKIPANEICRRLLRKDVEFTRQVMALISAGEI